MAETLAVIDIGTNSALLLIVRRAGDRLVSLHEEAQTPRLGAGVAAGGRIGSAAMTRLARTLNSYVRTCEAHQASVVIAAGTKVFRAARNARERVREVAKRTGLSIRILSAKEEAFYALHGALSGLPDVRDGVLVDIGGGSTEFVRFCRRKLVSMLSLPVGCVTLAETTLRRCCGMCQRRWAGAQAHIARQLDQVRREYRQDAGGIIGVGGTVTTLAALELRLRVYRAERVHGYVLSSEQLERRLRQFRRMSSAELARRIPFDPRRAAVLPAGTFLWAEVLKQLGAQWVTVSHRGLRWGIAQEHFARIHC